MRNVILLKYCDETDAVILTDIDEQEIEEEILKAKKDWYEIENPDICELYYIENILEDKYGNKIIFRYSDSIKEIYY